MNGMMERRVWQAGGRIVCGLVFVGTGLCQQAGTSVGLRVSGRVPLRAAPEGIAEAIKVPGEGYAVRCKKGPTAQVRLYGRTGEFLRSLDDLGAAESMALDADSRLWLPELRQRRLSLYSLQGSLLDTVVIKKPSFAIHTIAFGPGSDRYFLGGCLPTGAMVTEGCRLVHEYDGRTNRYLRSFLSTTEEYPNWRDRNYLRLLSPQFDSLDSRRLYVTDVPARGFWIIDLETGRTSKVTVGTKILPEVPGIVDAEQGAKLYHQLDTISRLCDTGDFIVLGIRRGVMPGSALVVFDHGGRFLARIDTTPGTLVGRTLEGNLLFYGGPKDAGEIVEAKLVSSSGRGSRR